MWGQGITPPQLRISPPVPAAARMLAIVNGRFQVVEIGAGVSLTPIAGGFKLEAAAAAAPVLRRVRLTRQADGSYTGAPAGSLVYRNGILQCEDDYSADAASGAVRPATAWSADDLVMAVYVGGDAPTASATPAAGPTRLAPGQVKDWATVRNPTSTGTSIAIGQLNLDPDVAELLTAHATNRWYPEYRVAVTATQRAPILITCQHQPCDSRWPLWFRR